MTTAILDGNNLAMRAFHVAKGHLTSDDGTETGSLHIFMASLSKLLQELRPARFVVCWDGGGSTYRLGLYPDYKATRRYEGASVLPAPHATTFALIRKFLHLAGISQWLQDGVEADDLIAAAVQRERQRDLETIVILSSDKDLMQCLAEPTVEQWRFVTGGHEVWDNDRLWRENGYHAEEIPRFMSMVGDTSDNIPGVRGIGPKKALKIMRSTEPTGFTEAQQNAMYLSYDLVKLPAPGTVVPEVPVYRPLSMASPEADWQAMADFCAAFQLRRLWTELEAGTLLAQGSPV